MAATPSITADVITAMAIVDVENNDMLNPQWDQRFLGCVEGLEEANAPARGSERISNPVGFFRRYYLGVSRKPTM